MAIFVGNESGDQVDEVSLVAMSRFVLDYMGVDPLAELSIMVVDETYMTELHVRYMGEPGPTDVLAFQQDDMSGPAGVGAHADEPLSPVLLGDVVLCPPVAARQAVEAGHSVDDELRLLCTHGILHLLGYDHADPAEHKEMFDLQATILGAWREAHPR